MTGPIKPQDIAEGKAVQIPEAVFEVFNELIARNCSDGTALVKQWEVIERLVLRGYSRSEILASHWLDIEECYRKEGWIVKYEKPGYNEMGQPLFTFISDRAEKRAI